MIKKIAVLVTALAVLPLAGLFAQDADPVVVQDAGQVVTRDADPVVAQDADPVAQKAEPVAQKAGSSEGNGFKIFSFDLIYGVKIKVPDFSGDMLVTPAFGLNFRFASDFIVGFEVNPGTGTFNGLNLKYNLIQGLRAVLYLGQNTAGPATTAAGLGLEYAIFSAKTALATDFRLGIRYIFDDVTDMGGGTIGVNLILGLGV